MKSAWVIKFMSYWPPFLGAGISVKNVANDFTSLDVELALRPWNSNYVGTHFGGSLYAMTDPFMMLMLLENLGKDYIVWDKAATIQFKKPARGRVRAHFEITEEELVNIRKQADEQYKFEPKFVIQVTDATGEIVAEVEKTLYVRRKDRKNDSRLLKDAG
ncbi:MAG: YiiD C-terminal domain-containing protein [Bdellovibrionales bacterium]|nr:YiiD C-terminal domain-containing protein [Bdellovibrionales bacterium]